MFFECCDVVSKRRGWCQCVEKTGGAVNWTHVEFVHFCRPSKGKPANGRPWKRIANVIIDVGHQDPGNPLKQRERVGTHDCNGHEARSSYSHDIIDRVLVLRCQDVILLVLVVNLRTCCAWREGSI